MENASKENFRLMTKLVNAKPEVQSVDRLNQDFKKTKLRKKNLQTIAPDFLITQRIQSMTSAGTSLHQFKPKITTSASTYEIMPRTSKGSVMTIPRKQIKHN